MRYTVKQLADLAGITRRALHFYDEIGLLHPAEHGDNGYRYYGEEALLRLQQILFFRELDFPLEQIKSILERKDFDLLQALEGHRRMLLERVKRTDRLIETVDNTIRHIQGEIDMNSKDFYAGFDEEKQKDYEQQARERWGDEAVSQSSRRWNANSREQKNAILAEGNEITLGVANNMDKGPTSPEVQYWVDRWYKSINKHFYDCSLEIFEALGHGYVSEPEFTAFYEKVKPGLAAFMEQAMTHYCQVMRAEAKT